jgi:hypothetical protein
MVGLAEEVPSSVISELRSWVQFMVGLAEEVAGMITYRAWDDCKVNLFCSRDKV